ncbi:MAG: glycoside hydrolase family protein [Smithella sp.]
MTIQEFITKHEGRRNKPYKCPAGFKTIGIGYNYEVNPLPLHIAEYLNEHGEITDEMIDYLLRISITNAVLDCEKIFPEFNNFTDNRRMALIDFVFQLGAGGARKFVHAIAAVNTGRWEDAAEGIRKSLYWKQLGGDPPGTDDGKLERPEEIANMILVG